MKFEDLLQAFQEQAVFDLSSVALLFPDESAATVRSSLYRYMRDGRLIGLRRGLYVFASPWQKLRPHAPYLARYIYAPSYISERWALSFYGIIPEKVRLISCVSTKVTRSFSNNYGEFRYRTLKVPLFHAFEEIELSAWPILIARPEKALLDLWYLESGEWTIPRMESFRFDPHMIKQDTLNTLAASFHSARIERAVAAWTSYCREISQGDQVL